MRANNLDDGEGGEEEGYWEKKGEEDEDKVDDCGDNVLILM